MEPLQDTMEKFFHDFLFATYSQFMVWMLIPLRQNCNSLSYWFIKLMQPFHLKMVDFSQLETILK